MQPHEALDVAAQVAVTLAGFAGIVVVFRPQSVHEWLVIDRFRLQILLANSGFALGYSLFGILLLAIDPPPISIWRWCSSMVFVAQIFFFVASSRMGRAVSATDRKSLNRLLFYSMALFATVALVLQVVNVAAWNKFWPFFAAIFFHLIAAIVQFIRMILLRPPGGGAV